VAFGIGQPAMISAVGAAARLVFLTGASIGAALVRGPADVIGVPGAFCLLVALPVAGVVALLVGGPDRVASTSR
jgi:hypothetical protein